MSLPILSTATEVTALSSLVTIPGQCHASCSSYFFLFIQPSSPRFPPLLRSHNINNNKSLLSSKPSNLCLSGSSSLPKTSILQEHLFTYRFTLSNQNNAVLTCSPRWRCHGSCSDRSSFVSTTTTSIEGPLSFETTANVLQPSSLRSMFTSMRRRVRVFETSANKHVLANLHQQHDRHCHL